MPFPKEKAMSLISIRVLTQFLVLAGIAILLPFYVHSQWITGPIINAILILTLFLVDAKSALVIGLVPSLIALGGGLLPAILAPVVPFIMIGNALLILVVDWFYRNFKRYWLGVLAGAGLKFLFLFFSVNIISRLLLKQELAFKVAQMMNWPQFATAVIGGMIAYIFLRQLKRI